VGGLTTRSILGAGGLLGTTKHGTGGPLQFTRPAPWPAGGVVHTQRIRELKGRGMNRSTVAKFGVPAVISAFAVGSALPAGAAPAQHSEESVVGDVFVCDTNTYETIAGTIKIVAHEGESASGNTNFTATLTPQNVVVRDEDGNLYRVSGAVWFGDTSNAQQESAQGTLTLHLNILSQGGGVVDRVALTGHFSTGGSNFTFDKGTCAPPAPPA
jgi:hypothetical protein